MSEVEARLEEARAALATVAPPDDLWARALEAADAGPVVLDHSASAGRRAVLRWLGATAVAACLLVVAAVVIADDDTKVSTGTASTPASDGASNVYAEDVEIDGVDGSRSVLGIDARVQGSQANGEFRMDGIVVAVQCGGSRPPSGLDPEGRDLILAGEVTVNRDGVTTLDEVGVGVGDRVALIIREGLPSGQRVTLYEPSLWHGDGATAGSCEELAESVPSNLDGGFFSDVIGTIRTP
jgi:hypothetical protein